MCLVAIEISTDLSDCCRGVIVKVHDPYGNSRTFYIDHSAGHALLEHVAQAAFGAINDDLVQNFKPEKVETAQLPF